MFLILQLTLYYLFFFKETAATLAIIELGMRFKKCLLTVLTKAEYL